MPPEVKTSNDFGVSKVIELPKLDGIFLPWIRPLETYLQFVAVFRNQHKDQGENGRHTRFLNALDKVIHHYITISGPI